MPKGKPKKVLWFVLQNKRTNFLVEFAKNVFNKLVLLKTILEVIEMLKTTVKLVLNLRLMPIPYIL